MITIYDYFIAVSVVAALVSSGVMIWKNSGAWFIPLIVFTPLIFVFISLSYVEVEKYSTDYNTMVRNEINSWSCEKLVQNILHQIKSANQTYLQYQKDLYQYSCTNTPWVEEP